MFCTAPNPGLSAQTYSAGKQPGCSAQEEPGVLPRHSSSNQSWLEDGCDVDWMSLPPAPEAILELVHCSCKKQKNCVRGKCTCKVYELPCTNLCKCTHCDNNILEEA